MKKYILFICLLSLVGLSACKKTYSCECTTVLTPQGSAAQTYPTASKTYSEKMSEKQAKSACDHEQVTVKSSIDDNINKIGAAGLITTNVTCNIK